MPPWMPFYWCCATHPSQCRLPISCDESFVSNRSNSGLWRNPSKESRLFYPISYYNASILAFRMKHCLAFVSIDETFRYQDVINLRRQMVLLSRPYLCLALASSVWRAKKVLHKQLCFLRPVRSGNWCKKIVKITAYAELQDLFRCFWIFANVFSSRPNFRLFCSLERCFRLVSAQINIYKN